MNRYMTLREALAAVAQAGEQAPKRALLDRLRRGELVAIAEALVVEDIDDEAWAGDDAEVIALHFHTAREAMDRGYKFGVKEVSRLNFTPIDQGFWIEIDRGRETLAAISWECSWASHRSGPRVLQWPPEYGPCCLANGIILEREQVLKHFPPLPAESGGSWNMKLEAEAISAFRALVDSKPSGMTKAKARAEMQRQFPDMPERAFQQRIWGPFAPQAWRVPGRRRE